MMNEVNPTPHFRTISFFICFLLVNCRFGMRSEAYVNEIQQKFVEANKSYEDGSYTRAIEAYENLLKEHNIQSAIIYYNLGNAYYRTNQIGKAILNYERAIKLNPRDEDIVHNLQYVKRIIKDVEEENIFHTFYKFLKVNELKVLLTITNILFFVSSGIYISKKTTVFKKIPLLSPFIKGGVRGISKYFYTFLYAKKLSIAFGSLLAIFLLWTIARISNENKVFAIVMSSATIRSGPGEDYTAGATVPEGKKLVVIGEQENYYAVALSIEGEQGSEQVGVYGKYKGWIKKDKLEKI